MSDNLLTDVYCVIENWCIRNKEVIKGLSRVASIFAVAVVIFAYFQLAVLVEQVSLQRKGLDISIRSQQPRGILDFVCPNISQDGVGVTNITFYNDGPQTGHFDIRIESNDMRVYVPIYLNEYGCTDTIVIKSKSGETHPMNVILTGRTPSFTASIGCLTDYCIDLKSQIYHFTCEYVYNTSTKTYYAKMGERPNISTDQEKGYCGREKLY